jgi:multisite-specific tRNA:(cytosine-C5)-methyltransferase
VNVQEGVARKSRSDMRLNFSASGARPCDASDVSGNLVLDLGAKVPFRLELATSTHQIIPMARGRGNKRGGRGGRGGGGGRGGNKGRGGGGDGKPYVDNRTSFEAVNKENEKFERYYNGLNIVPEGPEREAFWSTFKRELPNAFRFCGSKGHALSVRKNLTERYFPLLKDITHNDKPVEMPQEMSWYPEGLAYSMTTPKNVIRKYEPFKEFQKFLVSETGVGNISRQEQVSMIPPLVLDVQPHHSVLDLCAAPGSKSAQLVELLHMNEEERVQKALQRSRGELKEAEGEESHMSDFGRTTGLMIANDVNYQRAQMLVHQVKRLNSPNLVVTNHDATMFPSIELPSSNPKHPRYLKFDRVLADVPCSGDGTARKNPNVWKDWSPQNALGLYITQVRILVRSIQMLKSGGRVVYSTCSMNPMENEAVVASAIERCGGVSKVKLLSTTDQLPALKRSPGLNDWSIMARSGQIYESWPEAQQFEPEGSKVVPGMFPPEAEEKIPLENCMRVYPHQQDTGGFFIAILEKQSEVKAKPEPECKCSNRNWVYEEPQKAPITAILNEAAEMKTNENGLELKSADKLSTGPAPSTVVNDESSAARANEPAEESVANGKRKADDEPAEANGVAKKSKTAAGEDDNSAMADAQAGASAEAANSVTVDSAINDGVKNAPFEKAVPADVAPNPRRRRGDDAVEESFKYLDPTHPELESIYNYYNVHPSFPRERFLVRNPSGDPVKGIYYSSTLVRDILTANEGRGFKFVHAGVKMFQKQDVQKQPGVCAWRIQTEGLPILEGWVGEERVVHLYKRSTLRKLLTEMFPRVGGADGSEGWRELGEIGERVRDLGMGCCVLRVHGKDDAPHGIEGGEGASSDDSFEESITLPLWRSLHSLNLMLPKEERRAMLLRLYNEDVDLVNHTMKNDSSADATPAPASTEAAATKGSMSGEQDALELQEKIANAPDESATTVVAGSENAALDGMSAEQDSLAAEDASRKAKIEVQDDELNKVAAAMPERAGEEDVSNKTI